MEFFGVLGTLLGVFSICFSLYVRKKNLLILDIRISLEGCRQCDSWDEKSEDKLGPWIESERELHRHGYRALRRIAGQIEEYYLIHLKIDEDKEAGGE